jgi:hypothetical protein
MAITFVAKGAFASGTAALSVGVPAGYADGDIFLLMCESANQAVTTPTGWTIVTNSPQFTGTAAAAGGVRLSVFWKLVSGTQAAVAVADSGDHTTGIISCWRGCNTTAPYNTTAGKVDATATTALSCPTVTTTLANQMIVDAIALDADLANTTHLGTFANTSLVSITKGHTQVVTSGFGGGVAFAYGIKAVAGTISASTVTGATSTTHAYLTIALTPAATIHAAVGSMNIAVTETGAITAGIPAVGSMNIAVTETGAITAGIPAVGSMNIAVTETGAITAGIPAVGSMNIAVTLTGNADKITQVIGSMTSTVSMTGEITANRPVVGSLTTSVTMIGTITADRPVAGSLTSTAALSGAITADRPVAGSMIADITMAGSADKKIQLSGVLPISVTMSGDATLESVSTVTLNAPTNTSTAYSRTPALTFTGSDSGSNDLDYNIQIATDSSFAPISQEFLRNITSTTGDIMFSWQWGNQYIGQSFMVNTNTTLVSFTFLLKKTANWASISAGTYAMLYAAQGTYGSNNNYPTGAVLAYSNTVDVLNIPLSWGEVTYTFNTAISANTLYCCTLFATSLGGSGSGVSIAYSSNKTTSGNMCWFNSYWTPYIPELYFRLNCTVDTMVVDAISADHTGFSAGTSHPTASGMMQTYTPQADLIVGDTYYWRVRAKAPSGTNIWGAWSSGYSFLVHVLLATVDNFLRLRVLNYLTETSSPMTMSSTGVMNVAEFIEGSEFTMSPTGVLTVVELIEGTVEGREFGLTERGKLIVGDMTEQGKRLFNSSVDETGQIILFV